MMRDPDLSIVVTVVEGGPALVRCLEALERQEGAPAMEVLVPLDATVGDTTELRRQFAGVRFLDLGSLMTCVPANDFEAHVLYDERRSAGLLAARGRYIAMLEDRGWPKEQWAKAMIDLHDTLPHAVIGGAIECAPTDILRQALYFCDFGRYEPPLADGPADFVSDVNICYKRSALESTRPIWERRYQETVVNWALLRRGGSLYLADRPRVVQQRAPLAWGAALAERIHWGRTFGVVLGRERGPAVTLLRVAATPLVPLVVVLRHLRRQVAQRRQLWQYARVLPATFLLMVAWALGEAFGALSSLRHRQPDPPQRATKTVEPGVNHERSC